MDTFWILDEKNRAILRELLETLNWPISVYCIDCILPMYKLVNDSIRQGHSNNTEFLVLESHRIVNRPKKNLTNTPLHNAVILGSEFFVDSLMRYSFSVDDQNFWGETPIHVAAKMRHSHLLDVMLPRTRSNLMDAEGLTHLHVACMRDKTEVVEIFLAEPIDLNKAIPGDSSNWPGYTPLHFAAKYKSYQTVELLLSKGADPEIRDLGGKTPKDWATLTQDSTLMDLFSINNTDLNHCVDELELAERMGKTEIVDAILTETKSMSLKEFHVACRRRDPGIIRDFLKTVDSCDIINQVDPKNGYTALHYAVKNKCFENVKLLVASGANLSAQDFRAMTPIHLADAMHNVLMVDYLLDSLDVMSPIKNSGNGFQLTHFHIACKRGNLRIAKAFLAQGISVDLAVGLDSPCWPGYTGLHLALEYESIDLIQTLLECEADLTKKDKFRRTPIHLANLVSSDGILEMLLRNLQGKVNENPANAEGMTHFHVACARTSNLELVKEFLKLDELSVINQVTESGFTPLHFAVQHNKAEIVELLLDEGAMVESITADKTTPLHLACQPKDEQVCKLFQQIVWANIDLDRRNLLKVMENINIDIHVIADWISSKIRIINSLIKSGANVNATDDFLKTPLFHAFTSSHLLLKNLTVLEYSIYGMFQLEKVVYGLINQARRRIVEILMAHKSLLDTSDRANNTVLHLCAYVNQYFEESYDGALETEIFQSFSGDLNAKSIDGQTALHVATRNGNLEMVKTLLDLQVDMNCQESSGLSTPLHLAALCKHEKIVELLLERGADANFRDSKFCTALHNSVKRSFSIDNTSDKLVIDLLETDVEIDARDRDGNTALHLASAQNDQVVIRLLLDQGADPNLENIEGKTPPMISIQDERYSVHYGLNNFGVFVPELEKLRLIGKKINGANESVMREFIDPENCCGQSSMGAERFRDLRVKGFYEECEKEIEMMKNIKITSFTSLLDILHKNDNDMAMYAVNENLIQCIKADNFEIKFRNYKNLLKSRIKRGVVRMTLLQACEEALLLMFDEGLPRVCCRKIAEDLDNGTIYVLLDIFCLRKEQKHRLSRLCRF